MVMLWSGIWPGTLLSIVTNVCSKVTVRCNFRKRGNSIIFEFSTSCYEREMEFDWE